MEGNRSLLLRSCAPARNHCSEFDGVAEGKRVSKRVHETKVEDSMMSVVTAAINMKPSDRLSLPLGTLEAQHDNTCGCLKSAYGYSSMPGLAQKAPCHHSHC